MRRTRSSRSIRGRAVAGLTVAGLTAAGLTVAGPTVAANTAAFTAGVTAAFDGVAEAVGQTAGVNKRYSGTPAMPVVTTVIKSQHDTTKSTAGNVRG
jgi:hypothetical protein